MKVPVRDPKETPARPRQSGLAPSPFWGTEAIWDSQANTHNPMMDRQGRVWFTARGVRRRTPAYCKAGSTHRSARSTARRNAEIVQTAAQLAMYDPKTKQFTFIDTCFSTHHLQFAEDANDTLWLGAAAGEGDVVGWLKTKMFEETHDEQKSQGWTPADRRHQRQRQARRSTSSRASRSIRPRTSAFLVRLYGVSVPPMARCGAPRWAIPAA